MQLIEQIGVFYLGRLYDFKAGHALERPVMYDARDLTTHAVCVGMTGSGKTGLCIGLLEEAALDGVPAVIIDPKGDMTNLLLTFPDLRPEDFRPWVDPEEAARKGMDPETYAGAVASTWRRGLADWDQGPERIQLLRRAADFRVYTPGSHAGTPVSILDSFSAPALSWETHAEFLREEIQGTVSAILGLAGIPADPVRSREHILLANVFEFFWRDGRDLSLADLIRNVQSPPVRRIGVFELESFFPEKDRFALAMALNNLLASPAFAAWLEGDSLDPSGLFYTPEGKPRHSIFYIAHLGEAERMFFVTLLLQKLIGWMRRQSGTTSLRALIYMDEIFGYFPPVAEPPSKKPLLTLLKQARAFGVGVVLTTQNPVDLDYKGLTNAGTWFVGRLQTERDKARLLDGLESAAGTAGSALDRSGLDQLMSGLGSRRFLLHNVHEPHPLVFETRWCMSYLRGPLTRQEIHRLKQPVESVSVPESSSPSPGWGPPVAGQHAAHRVEGSQAVLPTLPPGVTQVYFPLVKGAARALAALEEDVGHGINVEARELVYEPMLVALGRVRFTDRRKGVEVERHLGLLLSPDQLGPVIRWDKAMEVAFRAEDLVWEAAEGARFTPVPEGLSKASDIHSYRRDFGEWLYRGQSLKILFQPDLKLYAVAGGNERELHARVQGKAREARDAEVEFLRRRMMKELDRLEAKLERERLELAQNEADHKARQREELLSGAESLIGLLGLFGRRRTSGLTRAATKRRMTSRARADVEESKIMIARLEEDLRGLENSFREEAEAIKKKWSMVSERFEEMEIGPKKKDVLTDMVELAWVPQWRFLMGSPAGGQAWRHVDAWR